MYKQFSQFHSINTSERNYKKNKINNKYSIKNYDSRNLFQNIYKKNKKNNWLPSIKKKTYFSIVPLLITNKTSIDYITNKKCCSPYHVYKKKGYYLYK